jgi:hypothetical protein
MTLAKKSWALCAIKVTATDPPHGSVCAKHTSEPLVRNNFYCQCQLTLNTEQLMVYRQHSWLRGFTLLLLAAFCKPAKHPQCPFCCNELTCPLAGIQRVEIQLEVSWEAEVWASWVPQSSLSTSDRQHAVRLLLPQPASDSAEQFFSPGNAFTKLTGTFYIFPFGRGELYLCVYTCTHTQR